MKHVVSGMEPYLNLDGSTGAYVEMSRLLSVDAYV
jgi:hypothetical protein